MGLTLFFLLKITVSIKLTLTNKHENINMQHKTNAQITDTKINHLTSKLFRYNKSHKRSCSDQ